MQFSKWGLAETGVIRRLPLPLRTAGFQPAPSSQYRLRIQGLALLVLSIACIADCALARETRVGEPVYAPDRRHVAFIRTSKKNVSTGSGDVSADVICYGSTKADAQPLFATGAKLDTHKSVGMIPIGGINEVEFSPDGKTLYFQCACYAVSDAIIAVDLASRKLRYVVDGNDLQVVSKGSKKGFLKVTRHAYHPGGGGSYEKEEFVNPN